jgi:nucleotide-binding universal stress UspA family protein
VFRRILLKYDGSDLAHRAFGRSPRLAAGWGSQLAVVAVIRPSEAAVDFAVQTVLDQSNEQLAAQLAQLARRARLVGIEMSALGRRGHPVREVLGAAQECARI